MKHSALFVVAALLTAGCAPDHTLLRERAAQWQIRLDAAVPSGTSIDAARVWGAANGISFTYLEQQRQLHAVAERVPESGFNKLVCSEWSILLKIGFSVGGVSERNEVATVGTCL